MRAAIPLARLLRKAGDDVEKSKPERERLHELGKFMAERWPTEKAGEFGRYLIAMHVIKQPLTAEDNDGKVAELRKREPDAVKAGGDLARFYLGTEYAKLGGFLGRKGDGEPGWITIWRGWEKLHMLVRGAELAAKLKKCG